MVAVVGKLAVKPETVKFTATLRTQETSRSFVEFHYKYTGKLADFGKFLLKVAKDVEQAGANVVNFTFSQVAGLSPTGSVESNYKPDQPWEAPYVVAVVRTKEEIEGRRAQFDGALEALRQKLTGKA